MTDQIRKQVADRLKIRVLGYLANGDTHDEAAHYAIADEIVRNELRMRAMAEAALDLAVPKSVKVLKAIAEGRELP